MPPRGPGPVERTMRRVVKDENGCWIFTGGLSQAGYGRVGTGSLADGTRGHTLTHRVIYEAMVGPVPDGLELDHLCRVRACCNPDHLEPVTHRENVLRGVSPMAVNATKDRCPQGHRYEGRNLGWDAGGRICRACKAEYQRQLRAARRPTLIEAAAREGRVYRTPKPVAECGSDSGYRRHYRQGQKPCSDCKAAHRAYIVEYEARRRDATTGLRPATERKAA